jgi:hypothetical protein
VAISLEERIKSIPQAAISWKHHRYTKGIFGGAQREKESRWEKSIFAFAGK